MESPQDSFRENLEGLKQSIQEFYLLCQELQAEIDRRDEIILGLLTVCVTARKRFFELNEQEELREGNSEAVEALDKILEEAASLIKEILS